MAMYPKSNRKSYGKRKLYGFAKQMFKAGVAAGKRAKSYRRY